MKKLWFVLLAVVVVSALVFIGCPGTPAPEEPIVIKFVSFKPNVPPDAFFEQTLIDNVNEMSGGELTIDWVGGPEAIPMPDAAAAAAMGSIDMVSALYGFADPLCPGMECMAFTPLTMAEIRASGAWDIVKERFMDNGLYMLGHSVMCEPDTMAAFFSSVRIEKIDDFKGLNVAAPSPTYAAFTAALGANPAMMTFADYFTAMERGTVDAYSVGVPGMLAFGLVDVSDYMVGQTFGTCGSAFFVNMDVWNSLSPHLQDVMNEAAIKAEADALLLWDDLLVESIATAEAAGMEVVEWSPAEGERLVELFYETSWALVEERAPELTSQLKPLLLP